MKDIIVGYDFFSLVPFKLLVLCVAGSSIDRSIAKESERMTDLTASPPPPYIDLDY